MKADKIKKLATILRDIADASSNEKREKTAKIAVAAVGLDVLQRKILSEVQ